ncbi:tripartite tricarboxylate transporter permease [Chelativorans alearense]|uniref:tripartite tricarboxylate transporter permease n=1 Tax=Chelativorans alearense TaxID=2681495 RepID=UPI0013D5C2DD|nr:tripartite tricarboxylate transporter permease [Chelativorans alearense]
MLSGWENYGTLFIASFTHLWIIIPAVVLGILVGAIPGFSAQNTLLILLPLTLVMDIDTSMAFMVSVYCASHMGAGIPAILINMPGTGGHAATCLDGFAMTKQGRSQEALAISAFASVVGGLFTTILAIAFLPLLSRMGLYLHSVDMVVIMVFGLCLIAMIATDDLVKGLIAGFFGLLMGVVGTDFIYGTPRATFGFIELYEGVPLVPALIGLLAISEAMVMFERESVALSSQEARQKVSGWTGTFEGIRQCIRQWWILAWTSFIGLLIGIVPGAGASIASFVAYAQARLFSSDPQSFGRGSPTGLIAAESSNNGVTSGTLVPLLAIGVPGGTTAAVMAVVLQYNGVLLGPRLFTDRPETAYGIFFSMLAAYIVMVFLVLPLARYVGTIVLVPTRVLVPLILSLTVVASLANRGYVFDIYVALVFGVIGYICRRTGYNVIAVLIGVLLGPLFEQYLLRSLRLGQGDLQILFSSSIGNTLWGLLALSLALQWWKGRKMRRALRDGPAAKETINPY